MEMPDHQILDLTTHAHSPMAVDAPKVPASSLYVKVANFPGLYRHTKSGRYYGVKKVSGKRKERSLGTSDRMIAERRYKDWVNNLTKVNSELEKTTLKEIIEKTVASNKGKSETTQKALASVIKCFRKTWRYGLDMQVRNVRPSQLDEWLAMHEPRLRNTSYNRFLGFIKQFFELAVKDRIIPESPCKYLKTPWKKPQKPIRHIPTIQQFEAIVECVRTQKFTNADGAEAGADFLSFLGLAGLGQAEAWALKWKDVDWGRNRLNIRRQKTDTHFYVPIYPHLRPLMEKLKTNAGRVNPNARVFQIKNARGCLKTACRTLRLPPFSQRNLRQCLIMRLWKSKVDLKLIARWQGHQDGGQLIIDTYTEVFGDDNDEYERQQIAKISGNPGTQNVAV